QSGAGSATILDARVSIPAVPPPGAPVSPVSVEATHAAATNKLLYAATIPLAAPGRWTVRTTVSLGAETADVSCELPVVPAAAELTQIWPYLAIPPLVVALFVLHQWLAARRRPPAPGRAPAQERRSSISSASGRMAGAISRGTRPGRSR